MINILEMSDLPEKVKRIERISGRLASKVRLTPATALSLRKNIDSNNIKKAIDKYNDTYMELRNAVVSAEVAAAEQEARDSALKNPNEAREEELRNAQIAEDNLVARITSVEVAKPRIDALKMSIEALPGRFGTLGKNFGVNVKSNFAPKALSIPTLYSKEYRVIFRNGDLYKLADKIGISDQNSLATEQAVPIKVANWRGLFNDIPIDKKELNVAMDAIPDPETEEKMNVEPISRVVTSEELSHRKMLGELGDEIQEVRRLQKSSNGLSSPFSAGLSEREDTLLGMLSNLSGIEAIAKKKVKVTKAPDNTEFQNLIDQIVGYKEPITEEEHKKKERSMEEYYSDPEVSQIIDDLRHKDMLFAFNQPEVYNKVMESERLDNDRKASLSTAVDVLDFDNEDETDDGDSLPVVNVENNVIIENTQDINSEKQDIVLDIDAEKKALLDGALEQAKLLQKQNEYADIVNGAEEQANMLQLQNDRIDLIAGAEEQARMLKTLYDFMDKQEEMDKRQQEEQEKLKKDAEEQAKMLLANNEKADLVNGAEEQAKMLLARNEQADLANGAEEQAKMLLAGNEQADLVNGAEEQAKMLLAGNEQADLANGAEEQAKMLLAGNEQVDLTNGAEEQAKMLLAGNEQVDLTNGAEEQAKMLLANNERADLANGAEEQAKMLIDNNKQADLANGAEEQARMILANNEQADLVNGAEEQARLLQRQNEYAELATGAEEQANILFEKNKEADLKNAEEERQKKLNAQYERADLILGSYEQALILQKEINSDLKASINNESTIKNEEANLEEQTQEVNSNVDNEYDELKKGALEQAKIIQRQNEYADLANGAEEQARLLQRDISSSSELINVVDTQTNNYVPQTKSENFTITMAIDDNMKKDAEEQAKLLQRQNEYADLANGSEEQAKLLQRQNEYADLANGAEEQARIIIENDKKSNVKMPQINMFEIVDKNDRYGNIVSPSKPIKLGPTQMSNMAMRMSKNKNRDFSKKREILNSVKEQLESQDFDFLKYNDSVVTA